MNIRRLENKELLEIYEMYGSRHFPEDELKPLASIEWLLSENCYLAYGLWETEGLLGYACLVHIPGQRACLLDYYAVLEEYRNGGIGGTFLALLQKELEDVEGIYIETENPQHAADPAERLIREKRIAFYERNGAINTDLGSTLFGVDYRILYLGNQEEKQAEQYQTELDEIYRAMFPQKYYRTQVKLYKA